jgi:hypothetical protein
MTLRFLLVFALATSTARADEAPPLDVFLEQRVAEELAADGMQLSRLGVALEIELVGDKAIVSLIEPSTGRVAASSKLALPADREAAIASVTQVAANLAAQLQPPRPNDFKEALQEERADRERKEELEARYKQEAIHFGHLATADEDGTPTAITSIPFRGDRRLDALEFFQAVERPDLVERVRSRRTLGKRVAIAGGAMFLVGSYFIYRGAKKWGECDIFMESYDACHGSAENQLGLGFGGIFGGAAVMFTGLIIARVSPISERTAHDLADRHNEKLRQRLQLAPYVGPQGGGLSMSGRF